MSASVAWAVVLGATLGLGLWTVVGRLPRMRAPRLDARIAPSLVDVAPEARRMLARRTADPLPLLGGMFAPVVAPLQRVIGVLAGRIGNGGGALADRLARAGRPGTERAYRLEQLLWAATGLVLGGAVAVVVARNGSLPAAALPLLPLIGVGVALWAREADLSASIRKRRDRIAEELPAVLEFLSLSLAAGESLVPALRRVSDTAGGEFSAEIGHACRDIAAGVPTSEALRDLAVRVDSPPITRLVGQLVAAIERGTPLVGVLGAQADDARVESRRKLMETAGKKEVAMMVPLVFMILPATVAVAVFPGIIVLYTGF